MGCVYIKEIKETRKKKWTNMKNISCMKENVNALPPLLIHSIDAAVIRTLVLICDKLFNFIPATIHDANSVHPNNIDSLLHAWKISIDQVLGHGELTNKKFIENIWLIPTLSYLENHLKPDDINVIMETWNKEWDKKPDMERIIKSNEIFAKNRNLIYE